MLPPRKTHLQLVLVCLKTLLPIPTTPVLNRGLAHVGRKQAGAGSSPGQADVRDLFRNSPFAFFSSLPVGRTGLHARMEKQEASGGPADVR